MSAASALKAAKDAGIEIEVEGSDLIWKTETDPPREVLDLLAQYKADIVLFLRANVEVKSAEECRASFEERAAILEFDHGLTRVEAERQAYEDTVVDWLNSHPFQGAPDVCAGCGGRINAQGNLWRSLGDGATVHYGGTWELECFNRHGIRRREEAMAALAKLGIEGQHVRSIRNRTAVTPTGTT